VPPKQAKELVERLKIYNTAPIDTSARSIAEDIKGEGSAAILDGPRPTVDENDSACRYV
jgi:hypothetical protein